MSDATGEQGAPSGVGAGTESTASARLESPRAVDAHTAAHPRIRVPLWITVAGWYGVFAIAGAYFLSTHDYIEQDGLYLFLNTSGAIGVALLAWKKHAWQAVVLELVWATIGLSALWRLVV